MKLKFIALNGISVELEYSSDEQAILYKRHGEKSPKTTRCKLKIDGIIVEYAEVVKHITDIDNPMLAIHKVTKKVLKNLDNKEQRTEIWKAVLAYTKKGKIENTEINYNDADEWFINNFVGLATSELALVRSKKIERVDRKKLLNWFIENM